MKKTLTLIALCAGLGLQAQYYLNTFATAGRNPGNINQDAEYPVGSGLDPSWTQFHTSSASPAWSPVQTIPFAFSFNGAPVTQFKVSNSGVLTFDVNTAVAAPSFTTQAIPSASIPDSSVMVWGIQGTGANDFVVKKTFGSAPYRQHWIFFTSYAFSTFYTYWSIVLEETTNNIYVVDQRSSGSLTNLAIGIQVNSTTAYGVNNGNNNVSSLAGTDATPGDNAYYEFIPGTRPNQDMSAQAEANAAYLILSQAPFTINADFKNFGSQNVTSYTMNYSVNNGPAVSGNISSVNVATGATTTGNHPVGWTPPSTGNYNLKVWADNINGNPDGYNFNDTIYFPITVVDTLTTRKVCMEVFTSSTCGPCAAGNANMDNNIIPAISNFTVIKYQQDFPGAGDPYQTTQAVNRRGYYGINSIPRMEIDGQWDGNAANLTVPIFNSYQQMPSFMEIDINSAYYNGTNVTVNAQIKPLINYGGNNYRYHIVVIEKQTTGNVGTNGETVFNEVMMKMHPNENGTSVTSLTAGNPININQTISMSGTFVEQMSDLKVVIFVQDNSTKEILQSEWLDVLPNGIAENGVQGNAITSVYPNPANESATVNFTAENNETAQWTITNTLGQVVMQGAQFNAVQGVNTVNVETSNLAEGVYFFNLIKDGVVSTERLVISR